MLRQVSVRVRRVDERAHAAAFAAAWLVAELARDWAVQLVRADIDLIELDIGHGSEDRSPMVEVKAMLDEQRFRGWELCRM